MKLHKKFIERTEHTGLQKKLFRKFVPSNLTGLGNLLVSDFLKELFTKGIGAQYNSESDSDDDIPKCSRLGKIGKTASV